jgi:hypothetical protein
VAKTVMVLVPVFGKNLPPSSGTQCHILHSVQLQWFRALWLGIMWWVIVKVLEDTGNEGRRFV